jgi:membrane-associated phospholipid phosphatase
MRTSHALSTTLLAGLLLWGSVASADPPVPDASPSVPPAAPAAPAAPTAPAAPPTRVPLLLEQGQHFSLDPVSDGVLTASGFGFALLLGAILGTGEIQPPLPSTNFSTSSLLSIDRTAISQTIDPHASSYSNIGLYTAIGFAVLDPVLSGLRDGTDAALVDAFIYAESASLALTLTDITKIAVRRPRPIDYINCGTPTQQMGSGCTSTDLGLSFFSGHAATVSSIGATATYLAFVRSPHSPRPWITLGLATALTAFVSVERVRAGEHFPTDVIAGSMAGAAVGVLVPHLHRHKEEAPPVWIGITPAPGGGTASVSAYF